MRPCDLSDALERRFVREFEELRIQPGVLIRSVTGTVRRVLEVVLAEGCPEVIVTEIIEGTSREGKTHFTLREVVLGFRKSLASIEVPFRMFQ